MMDSIERILIAAIWYKDLPLVKVFDCNVLPINCSRGIVFCGFRHPQAIYSMCSITGKRSVEPEVGEYEQGFLTSKNRFVGRNEAAGIAQNAGQINWSDVDWDTVELYSEDLY